MADEECSGPVSEEVRLNVNEGRSSDLFFGRSAYIMIIRRAVIFEVFIKGVKMGKIRPCTMEHADRYGEIYAEAFSGEPWNDPWKMEDAVIHVKEILEMKQSYGLEYVEDGVVVGFLLGSSMLFHYGRTFEINDLAVDPAYQGKGIAKVLLERCIEDMKARGIAGIHLITANEGFLPEFYKRHGFGREDEVILMGLEI